MRTLGLYVHIPFCLRKCAYCSFVSVEAAKADIDRYIEAVIHEAWLYKDMLKNRAVDTVFIGGGTPTLLSPSQLQTLVGGLRKACNWQAEEFTVEANPETVTADKLKAFRDAGVNRLSIGLQTHDNNILARIGRRHTWRVFVDAYEIAARFISNINIDTIFGLPGQNAQSQAETIRRVIALEPQHVSAYALKLEPGTPLAESFAGADEDSDRQMCHLTTARLSEAGFTQYETSNYAKRGFECHHNLKYWTGGAYLGLGAAAHSYLDEENARRFGNMEDIRDYMDTVLRGERSLGFEVALSDYDKMSEYIMLRLRLNKGIDFNDFNRAFGTDFKRVFEKAIETTRKAGLITVNPHGIGPTQKGFDLQNTLIAEFIKKL